MRRPAAARLPRSCEPARTDIKARPAPAALRSRPLGRLSRAAALALATISGGLAAPATAAETITVVAFGDSLTQGYGLPAEDGFAPQLERWLNDNGAGPVTVVNAGVSGDTTAGGLARLDWSIGPEADAVILELGANDALRGLDPAAAKANLDAMLTRLKRERGLPVLLAGMRAPLNWGAEYKAAFDGMYAELAETHQTPLYDFFLAGLADDLDAGGLDTELFLPNDFHPSAKGVALIVENIGPDVLALVRAARRAGAPS